jgi:hypothetical protein
VRLFVAMTALLFLGTCTYSNLCPHVCLEEGCCDPTCKTPGDDLSACDPNVACTYMGVNYTITCGSDSLWHCQGGVDFCCPVHQPTVGTACTPGLQCEFPHGIACECDNDAWNCIGVNQMPDGGGSD